MFIKNLSREQKYLRKRILEISYERKLSHLGSCLSAIDAIDAVYKTKKSNERFILSNGHAGVALYVVLEKHKLLKTQNIDKLHIHPDKNPKLGIDVSTGSLGQGLPIAVGIALANRKKHVYCMISDGECAEGSIWEALRIATEQKLENLKIILNFNGWGAYGSIQFTPLLKRLKVFGPKVVIVNGHRREKILTVLNFKTFPKPLLVVAKTTVEQLPFLKGQDAHYHAMTKEEFEEGMKILE